MRTRGLLYPKSFVIIIIIIKENRSKIKSRVSHQDYREIMVFPGFPPRLPRNYKIPGFPTKIAEKL